MPRTTDTDTGQLMTVLLRLLEAVRDASLVPSAMYMVHLEITASSTDNYENSQRLGLSSTTSCTGSRMLYNCSRGVATFSADFLNSASTDLESTPLCFSTSLSTDDDASYNFCMQGTNTSTSTDTATFTSVSGSGYGASPLAAYLSPYEMP